MAVESEHPHTAFTRPVEAEKGQDEGGLSRPVRTQQPHGSADAGNAETAGDPPKDLPPSQSDFEVVEFDDR
jgi:hypothetical protein